MKPRIVVRLQGGLGNQMFQCALGIAASRLLKEPVTLDASALGAFHTPREYALDCFADPLPLATREEVEFFEWKAGLSLAGRIRQRLARFRRPRRRYHQRGLGYDTAWQNLRGPLYLDGYWQDERYFEEYADEVRTRFCFARPLPPASAAAAGRITACAAPAFVHVRRGDYVSDAQTQQFHGVCGADYFRHGIERLRSAGADAFFVFSEDRAWCDAHLAELPGVAIVDPAPAWEHLQLMSLCRHGVISNSSFSWWAAWLIPQPDKCIVTPARWFRDDQANREAAGIIPPTWLRM